MHRTLDLETLLEAGFHHAGTWKNSPNGLETLGPDAPGLYAFVEDDVVKYVGRAERGLRRRLRTHRRRAEGRGVDALRDVHLWLRETIASGASVDVYVVQCADQLTHWRGLPVDVMTGLESALIRQMVPAYNASGRSKWVH